MFGLLKIIKSNLFKLKAAILKKEISNVLVWRFIFDKRDISIVNKKIKYAAFYDNRYNDLSVYNKKLSTEAMFSIGDSFVGSFHNPPKRTIAAGEIESSIFTNKNLKLISYPYPHKLHINITGFPSDNILKRHIAHQLADSAKLILREY